MNNRQTQKKTNVGRPNQQPKGKRGQYAKTKGARPIGKQNDLQPGSNPLAFNTRMNFSRNIPQASVTREGWVLRHKELVSALNSPLNVVGTFVTLGRFRINPGSAGTFPWLSRIAPCFEGYRFRKLRFHWLSRLPTTSEGSNIMSPDYDAADGAQAVTETFIFSNQDSKETTSWDRDLCIDLPTSRLNQRYKSHVIMSDTRFANTSQDVKTIDAAQLFCCTDFSTTSAQVVGKLVVEYDVELLTPQAPTDDPTKGGVTAETTNLASNVNTPFQVAIPAANTVQEATPILNFSPPAITYPSDVVGQFLRDWEGVVTTNVTGTVLSGVQTLLLGTQTASTRNVGLGDTIQPNWANTYAGSATAGTIATYVNAKANQYLRLAPATTLTTLTNFRLAAGGASTLSELL